jgi:hypothetical protein
MSSFSLHSAAVLALQAAIGLSAAGCVDIAAGEAQFVDTIEKRFAVSGTPILMVGTFDGSVEVSTWDRSEVLVTIERRAASREEADRMLITAEQSGDEIRVQVKSARPDGGFHFNFGSFNARVVVNVPTKARIDASTGDGRVYVRDVEGDLVARTGDGSIHLERVNGAIEASSGDGSITVDGQIQRLKARSGDGRVRVHAVGAAPDWRLVALNRRWFRGARGSRWIWCGTRCQDRRWARRGSGRAVRPHVRRAKPEGGAGPHRERRIEGHHPQR